MKYAFPFIVCGIALGIASFVHFGYNIIPSTPEHFLCIITALSMLGIAWDMLTHKPI